MNLILSRVTGIVASRVFGYLQDRNVLLMFVVQMYVTAVGASLISKKSVLPVILSCRFRANTVICVPVIESSDPVCRTQTSSSFSSSSSSSSSSYYYYYYVTGCTTFPHLPARIEHL